MLRFSQTFSKAIFWLENLLFYIPEMLVYEAVLVPIIYLSLVYNILRTESNIKNSIGLVIAWLLIGPVYLLYNLIIDIYYYFKVLFDYHEDDTLGYDQDKEDELQDLIVIYNEVIDTMRAIMNIFKHKKPSLRARRKKSAGNAARKNVDVHEEFGIRKEDKSSRAEQLQKVSNKFDLLEELQRQRDDDDPEEGYTIDK